MPLTPALAAAIEKIAQAAVACEKQTGCPAQLLAAQCAIESGWLQHAPGNNCFGIKNYFGAAGKQLLHTAEWFTDAEREVFLQSALERTAVVQQPVKTDKHGRHLYNVTDWFATFPTLTDCFLYRGRMFNKPPYLAAAETYRTNGDFPTLVRTIAPIYATDPGYADTVLRIAQSPELQAAITAARGQIV